MSSIIDKLESSDNIERASYNATENIVSVQHTRAHFTSVELQLVKGGKLVPKSWSAKCVVYDVNITISDQQKDVVSESVFSF